MKLILMQILGGLLGLGLGMSSIIIVNKLASSKDWSFKTWERGLLIAGLASMATLTSIVLGVFYLFR